jgi:hypothetical protein
MVAPGAGQVEEPFVVRLLKRSSARSIDDGTVTKLLKVVFWIALPLTLAGWWQGNDFVDFDWLPSQVVEEPQQKKARKKGFNVEYNDVVYTVEPKYAYTLYGMVVSFRYHDGDRMLHKVWNDHLNVADVCVVWGDNMGEVNLNAFDFFNGQFTCNFSTGDQVAWQQFRVQQLSNNHLLTADDDLRSRITEVRVGDIIRVEGWLSWYGQAGLGNGAMRKTSVTRDDTGNGACETIYVRDFEIIRSMPNPWRTVFTLFGILTLLTVVLFIVGVGSGRMK